MKKIKAITAIALCAALLAGSTAPYTVQAAQTTETTTTESKAPSYKNFFKKYNVPSKLYAKCYAVVASTGEQSKATIYMKKSGKSASIVGSNKDSETVDGVVYDILSVKVKDGRTLTVYVNRKTQKISKIIDSSDDEFNLVVEYLPYEKITAPKGAENAVKTSEDDFSVYMLAFGFILGDLFY